MSNPKLPPVVEYQERVNKVITKEFPEFLVANNVLISADDQRLTIRLTIEKPSSQKGIV